MSNQRGTFAKRQRETNLKDRARAKAERRAAKRGEERVERGPQIDWDNPGGVPVPDQPAPTPPTSGSDDTTD